MKTIDFRQAKPLDAPFWACRMGRVFSPSVYEALVREYEFFRRYTRWEKNTDYEMELTGPRDLNSLLQRTFGAPEVVSSVSKLLGIPVLPYIQAGFHYHAQGKPDGMVHHDYVYVKCGEAKPRVAPAMTFAVRAKYARAMTLLYYLGNNWADRWSDGGTGLYAARLSRLARREEKNPVVFSRVAYVPPVNNTALIFKNTPDAWHGFVGNSEGARRSIAVWYLSPAEAMEKRLGVAPFYFRTSIEKGLEHLRKRKPGLSAPSGVQ